MNLQVSSQSLSQTQLYFSEEERIDSKDQDPPRVTLNGALQLQRQTHKQDESSDLGSMLSSSLPSQGHIGQSHFDSNTQESQLEKQSSYHQCSNQKVEQSGEDHDACKQEEEDYCNIKIEPRDHYQYVEKKRQRRNQNIMSIVDSQTFDRRLMQMAKIYHKTMVEEAITQIKVKEQQGLKQEHQEPPFDPHLNQFPLSRFIQQKFGSVEELMYQLEEEQKHIEEQLAALGHEIKVDFYRHYTKTIKKTDHKIFSIFSCKYHPKCQAIIKACQQKERCCVYLLRNKHCHNVRGEVLEEEFPPEKPGYIDLDEDLHAMFGLHKGVITETRNKRYLDPKAKRQAKREARAAGNSETKPERRQSKPKRTSSRKTTSRTTNKTTDKRDLASLIQSGEEEFQDIIEELTTMKLHFDYDEEYQKDNKTQNFNEKAKASTYPKMIVIASKEMLDSFAQFGSITKFQLLKEAIKLNKKKQSRINTWSLGIFTGSNSNIFPTMFAFCLIQSTEQMRLMYPKIIKSFFRIMDSEPTVIMTQHSPEIIDAVKALKSEYQYKGVHLLDQNQKLTKIKKGVKDHDNLPRFKLLLNSKSPSETHRIWDQLLLKGEDKALSLLKDQQEFYIWSHIPEQLIGFSINMDSSEKISSYLKVQFRHLPLKKTLKAYILKVLQASEYLAAEGKRSMHSETDVKVESIFNDKELGRVRKSVGPKVLNQVYKQYGQAIQLTFITSDLGKHHFEDGHFISQEENCSCRIFQYSGIPCKHLLRMIRSKGASYMTHVHPRWVIRNPDQKKGTQTEGTRQDKCRKYSFESESSSS